MSYRIRLLETDEGWSMSCFADQPGETQQLDRDTGRKRGFAFVEMAEASAETKAISDLQDVEWMGRSIRVNKAEPRPTSAFGNSRW
jgi:RNA recognition motif-containing protein